MTDYIRDAIIKGIFENNTISFVDKEYSTKIQTRICRTMEIARGSKPVISVLITTYGLQRNDYSGKFQKVITLEDLFQ